MWRGGRRAIRSGSRPFCSAAAPRRWTWAGVKEFLSHFSPRTKPELRFDNFPRHTGHEVTLGTILGINVAVFAGWQVEQLRGTWTEWFLWNNTAVKDGKWWLLVTPSFSHKDLTHLVGNMTMFLYLGKRLHQFMGRARFVSLYLFGALAGGIGSELTADYRPDRVAGTCMRYLNIMRGYPIGKCESLGASDAVMAYVACWYFLFPRTQIHVFRLAAMVTSAVRNRGYFKTLTTLIDRYHPTCSALWFLPMVFVTDFVSVLELNPKNAVSHLSWEHVNVAAHVAGFSAGSLFHFFVTRPLKAKYYARNWYELGRRAMLIPLSLSVFVYLSLKLEELVLKEARTLKSIRLEWDAKEIEARLARLLRERKLMQLVEDADTCSVREAFMMHRTALLRETNSPPG